MSLSLSLYVDLMLTLMYVPQPFTNKEYCVSPDADTQPATKKLTIDKEFEQYFSMLML